MLTAWRLCLGARGSEAGGVDGRAERVYGDRRKGDAVHLLGLLFTRAKKGDYED